MNNSQNIYLKAMYLLSLNHKKIRVTDIANKLNYTKSSVSKALIKLNSNDLINYETYKDITLTETGKNKAEELLLKENTLELFLIGVLNVEEETAKKDIEIISHLVSNNTNEKLKEYIVKSLHLNNEQCKCNKNDPNCQNCETKIIQTRVKSNPKWLDTLKEEK